MWIADGALWAMQEFGDLKLGHKARTKRATMIAAVAAARPSLSIPKIFDEDWSQAKAAYEFFSNPNVTHGALLSGHCARVVEACRGRRMVLAVQDTTFLRFGGQARLESGELGPIDTKGKVGGIVTHTSLAIDATTHEVLGVLHQKLWTREKFLPSKKQRKKKRSALAPCDRESAKWGECQAAVSARLAPLEDAAPHVVAVYDREGDVFEALATTLRLDHGFVVRAGQNRSIDSDEPEAMRVLDALGDARARGFHEVVVPRGPKRPERRARLGLRSATVDLLSPRIHGRAGEPLCIGVVSATEEDPPPGVEPVSWVLLTTLPIATRSDILEVLRCYEARWIIEEFHMGLKTGCSTEKRQLHTRHALENVIAMASALSIRLLALRDVARHETGSPSTVLGSLLFAVLLAVRPKLSPDCSTRDALRAIAMMGGFLARKGDGEPGWRSLWDGFARLIAAARIWQLARSFPEG